MSQANVEIQERRVLRSGDDNHHLLLREIQDIDIARLHPFNGDQAYRRAIRYLVKVLIDTLNNGDGIGLHAVQLNELWEEVERLMQHRDGFTFPSCIDQDKAPNVIAIGGPFGDDRYPEYPSDVPITWFFNMSEPRPIEEAGTILTPEKCLSVPGYCVEMERHQGIEVSYYTASLKQHTRKIFGRLALIFQHEWSHGNPNLEDRLIDGGNRNTFPIGTYPRGKNLTLREHAEMQHRLGGRSDDPFEGTTSPWVARNLQLEPETPTGEHSVVEQPPTDSD